MYHGLCGLTHWLPGTNSPLNTTWFSASRSIERSNAWRTRASLPRGLSALGPLATLTSKAQKPSDTALLSLSLGSSRTVLMSVASRRSIRSSPPERRLASRTVESTIGR